MGTMIKGLCVMSLLCGVVISLAPEGGVKRVMQMVCSVLLMSMIFSQIRPLDMEIYGQELARVREREALFLESSTQAGDRLRRSVIEEQCEAYIAEKAAVLGLEDPGASVTARWDTEGFWLPYSVKLSCSYRQELARYLQTELGIPETRQQWSEQHG